MRTKKCSRCKQELPSSEFSKQKWSKDGLQAYCKSCNASYYQERGKARQVEDRELLKRIKLERKENVERTNC
jgi:hypothetical protein